MDYSDFLLLFLVSGLVVIGVLIALTRCLFNKDVSSRKVLAYVVASLWAMALTGFFGLAVIGQHVAHIDTKFSQLHSNALLLNNNIKKLDDFQQGSNATVSIIYEDLLARIKRASKDKSKTD